MVCLKYIIVNTLIKVIGGYDDDDHNNNNNNTWNVKNKLVAVIGGDWNHFRVIQIIAILGTAHILEKVLT